MHKIGQSRGFLDRLLGPLLKTSLLLMKNLLKPLAKSILIPLGLAAPVSAIVIGSTKGILLKDLFIPKPLYKPLGSCLLSDKFRFFTIPHFRFW